MLDEDLGGLEGVFSVVDDVVIAGCGQRVEDNEQKLTETLKSCAKKNIALNEDKQQTSLTRQQNYMAQYMSRFLPDLAETFEPICALTRKDTPFVWSTECESAFDT